jgi:hypothetical protein
MIRETGSNRRSLAGEFLESVTSGKRTPGMTSIAILRVRMLCLGWFARLKAGDRSIGGRPSFIRAATPVATAIGAGAGHSDGNRHVRREIQVDSREESDHAFPDGETFDFS